MKADTFGHACEIIALNYLRKLGYNIVATNYKNKIGEIDIICRDSDTLVFVEVKGRLTSKFGDPLEAIDNKKQIKIRQVASSYINKYKLFDNKVRFDVISILGEQEQKLTHIIDAF